MSLPKNHENNKSRLRGPLHWHGFITELVKIKNIVNDKAEIDRNCHDLVKYSHQAYVLQEFLLVNMVKVKGHGENYMLEKKMMLKREQNTINPIDNDLL